MIKWYMPQPTAGSTLRLHAHLSMCQQEWGSPSFSSPTASANVRASTELHQHDVITTSTRCCGGAGSPTLCMTGGAHHPPQDSGDVRFCLTCAGNGNGVPLIPPGGSSSRAPASSGGHALPQRSTAMHMIPKDKAKAKKKLKRSKS